MKYYLKISLGIYALICCTQPAFGMITKDQNKDGSVIYVREFTGDEQEAILKGMSHAPRSTPSYFFDQALKMSAGAIDCARFVVDTRNYVRKQALQDDYFYELETLYKEQQKK